MDDTPSQMIDAAVLAVDTINKDLSDAKRLIKYAGYPLSQEVRSDHLESLPNTFDKIDKLGKSGEIIDILQRYPWTVSNVRTDMPYIVLQEHRNTESTLTRMDRFYGLSQVAKATSGTSSDVVAEGMSKFTDNPTDPASSDAALKAYEEIYPSAPTGWRYILPYFTDTYLELNTAEWIRPNKFASSIKDISQASAQIATDRGKKITGDKEFVSSLNVIDPLIDIVTAGYMFANRTSSPVVGITDTPRIFTEHSLRSIRIEFPLYNTLNANDWETNKRFIDVFLMQNLFAKRNFITGSPPCYYRVHAPGQYFCYAASVGNFDVQNLGNTRLLKGKDGVVCSIPDAYQVSITLNEMVMPSLNQQQAIYGSEAEELVSTSILTKG